MIDFENRRLFSKLLASELNSTSTRYDRFVAGPSQDDAKLMWIIWSTISAAVGLFCLILFLGIVCSPKARKSAFNIYILFLVFPDIVFNLCCTITCAMSAAAGEYFSAAMCQWQSWYCVFDFTANSWMNTVIALELHHLLKDCKKGSHYRPPPIKQVVRRSLLVYIYSAFVASWTLMGFLPHRADLTAGIACLPVEFSIGSTMFFWCVFIPAFIGIPFSIFLYVCWDVYRNKLLPKNDRTRQLFIFFMRLTLVFAIMWLPTVILVFAIGVPDVWLSFAGGSWSHLQGLVSAALCLTKSDVRRAVTNFLGCRSHELDTIEDSTWYGNFRRSIKRRASTLISRGRRSSRLDDVIGSDANMVEASIIFRKRREMAIEITASSIDEYSFPSAPHDARRESSRTLYIEDNYSAEYRKGFCRRVDYSDLSKELNGEEFSKECRISFVDVEQPESTSTSHRDENPTITHDSCKPANIELARITSEASYPFEVEEKTPEDQEEDNVIRSETLHVPDGQGDDIIGSEEKTPDDKDELPVSYKGQIDCTNASNYEVGQNLDASTIPETEDSTEKLYDTSKSEGNQDLDAAIRPQTEDST